MLENITVGYTIGINNIRTHHLSFRSTYFVTTVPTALSSENIEALHHVAYNE